MSVEKVSQSFTNLGEALSRLEEIFHEKASEEVLRDATIQRFEFTIELYWKALKRLLAEEGIEAGTPKEVLKRAFKQGWIDDETMWLQMLQDRNETSHVYDQVKAKEIAEHIKRYCPELRRVYNLLSTRFSQYMG